MPIDRMAVAAVMGAGVSCICATCENYWKARDQGLPGHRCLAKDGCGGPISGDVFHEYRGQLTHFEKFCFSCGNASTHVLRVNSRLREIGCCREHISLIETLQPEGGVPVGVVIVSVDGERKSDEVKGKDTLRLRIGGSA